MLHLFVDEHVSSWRNENIRPCVLLSRRHRSNDVQPPPWSNPDWARPTLVAHNAPVEESCVHTTHVPHQVSNRRGSDHHLLCCGGKSAEWKWTVLQVSRWKSINMVWDETASVNTKYLNMAVCFATIMASLTSEAPEQRIRCFASVILVQYALCTHAPVWMWIRGVMPLEDREQTVNTALIHYHLLMVPRAPTAPLCPPTLFVCRLVLGRKHNVCIIDIFLLESVASFRWELKLMSETARHMKKVPNCKG